MRENSCFGYQDILYVSDKTTKNFAISNHYKSVHERLGQSGLPSVLVRIERLLTKKSEFVDFADMLPATNNHAATTLLNITITNRDPDTGAIVVSSGLLLDPVKNLPSIHSHCGYAPTMFFTPIAPIISPSFKNP